MEEYYYVPLCIFFMMNHGGHEKNLNTVFLTYGQYVPQRS